MIQDTFEDDSGDSPVLCKTVAEVRERINERIKRGVTIGFVPTMGALHDGHLSLVEIAKKRADVVVVSIFVNPTQFAPDEDYESYPRQLEKDLEACRKAGVDIVFAPDKDQLYDSTEYFSIEIDSLNDHMCGGSRPGFFEGVVLVVNKLFNIVEPDVAVFGQKDIQQVEIIRRMVQEFHHHVEIVSGPIMRANDGLALSSRNQYLDKKERVAAPGLYRSLQYIESQIASGVHTPKLLIQHQWSELEAKGFKIDYINVFDKHTLKPVETLHQGSSYIIAGAAYLGNTRLIDNILIEF